MVTGQVGDRVDARRRLFADVDLAQVDGRCHLVDLAQAGYAGLRLHGWIDPAVLSDLDRVRLVGLLRDARGVGLRVSWKGTTNELDPVMLCHLDPPRRQDGSFGWEPPTTRSLSVRRGPAMLSIDDTRGPDHRRFEVERRSALGAVLDGLSWSRRLGDIGADPHDHDHDADRLLFRSGDFVVGVAVRQGVWCA